jgi:preprotein translocase subunit SecG
MIALLIFILLNIIDNLLIADYKISNTFSYPLKNFDFNDDNNSNEFWFRPSQSFTSSISYMSDSFIVSVLIWSIVALFVTIIFLTILYKKRYKKSRDINERLLINQKLEVTNYT